LIIKFAEDCSQNNERCTNSIYTDDYHKNTKTYKPDRRCFVSVQNRPMHLHNNVERKTNKRNIHKDVINYGQINFKNNSSIISLISFGQFTAYPKSALV